MQSPFGDVAENLRRVESHVRAAASEGAEIVCFPELSLTGYSIRDDVTRYAEKIPGPASGCLVRMAREQEIVILAGMLEKSSGEKPYISQIVAGPSGIIGVYRKTHLSPMERGFYQEGDEIEVFVYDDIVFGIQLCYESHFPELSTLMTLQGVDMIFMPFASPNKDPEEKKESWSRMLPARAFDNSVFLVACNQAGENGRGTYFPGVIIMLDPSGKVIRHYAGHDEKMIVEELKKEDIERVRDNRMQAFMKYRRPELYDNISCAALEKNT